MWRALKGKPFQNTLGGYWTLEASLAMKPVVFITSVELLYHPVQIVFVLCCCFAFQELHIDISAPAQLVAFTGSKKAQFTWWRLLGLDEMDKMLSITHSNRFTNAEMSSFAIGWAKMLWVCLLRQKCKTFLSESLLSCCLFFFLLLLLLFFCYYYFLVFNITLHEH